MKLGTKRAGRIFRLISVVLAGVIGLQVMQLREGASQDDEWSVANPAENKSGAGDDTGEGVATEPTKPTDPDAAERPYPEPYDVLTSSGVFGKPPASKPPPPPVLIGLMDGRATRYALLRTGKGQTLRLSEGEEKDGIKLLRIGTNRVLIAFREKELELQLFSGLGGASLLPRPQEKKP